MLTGIAVAFPRSPMVTAATAWELAEASGGRFRLGLGSQVRAHMERRYGAAFEHPGPRLREYVLAVKQIFESFRTGAPLAVEGEFYNLSLLPPMWAPGAIDCADPPVDVAAVSPWMLRMAGEVADGVHVHPLNTPTYLRETLLPNVEAGAARSGRRVEDLEIIVPAFLVVGDTGKERAAWRERARMQVAFYGSTPNYAFIFEQLDREDMTDLLRERQRAGDVAGMAAEIDDDLLENFITEGTWDDIADKIVAKYGGIATRVVSYFTGTTSSRTPTRSSAGASWPGGSWPPHSCRCPSPAGRVKGSARESRYAPGGSPREVNGRRQACTSGRDRGTGRTGTAARAGWRQRQ